MVKSRDFVAIHARYKEIVPRVIRWITRFEAHAIGDTPAAQMLTSSRIGEIGCRKVHLPVALLDNEAANNAPGEIDRYCQAYRACARDENRKSLGLICSIHGQVYCRTARFTKLKSKTWLVGISLSVAPRLFWVKSMAPFIQASSADPLAGKRLKYSSKNCSLNA